MSENPLQVIIDSDAEFFQLLEETRETSFPEDGIPLKYKLLMAMALDASKGAVNGVTSLAVQAMEAGATKEEVMQAVKVTHYICGVGSVYVAANALKDVL
ncbi:Carboxymuconolactone decarboxylase family protein [Methanococcoides vulcani]|uniref:Carboxymuconolactone decarboxylase family protein n=1 Tax=Methanococcoides vulcani TaxID=1353158 RepID=A0A1H9YJA7_9EURY|nr:carboxymuconolactone decarboxylase family protein [Methanococcoides vulcani]SES69146.1 Carboxymuconolactone decarboxylase family protein [Methanococcoides vulcani]